MSSPARAASSYSLADIEEFMDIKIRSLMLNPSSPQVILEKLNKLVPEKYEENFDIDCEQIKRNIHQHLSGLSKRFHPIVAQESMIKGFVDAVLDHMIFPFNEATGRFLSRNMNSDLKIYGHQVGRPDFYIEDLDKKIQWPFLIGEVKQNDFGQGHAQLVYYLNAIVGLRTSSNKPVSSAVHGGADSDIQGKKPVIGIVTNCDIWNVVVFANDEWTVGTDIKLMDRVFKKDFDEWNNQCGILVDIIITALKLY